MELKSIKDALDHVVNKHKFLLTKLPEMIEMTSQEIDKELLSIIQEEAPPYRERMVKVVKLVKETFPKSQFQFANKEFMVALTKYNKVLEKQLNSDISKAYRNNAEFDTSILNQIIIKFFYRQGMFKIGDCFVAETGESECSFRQSFMEMYKLVEAMKRRDLEPALNWAISNSDKLKKASSDLEFKLHSLHFLEVARHKNSQEAIYYARKHISIFADSSFPEIQKLVCSLLWNTNHENSPYSEFISPALWNTVVEDLTRQYCNLLGESTECPLSMTIAAGTHTLPVLLKYMMVIANTKLDWQKMEQFPVDMDLSKEFQFRSAFVCPISKEWSSADNPPMLMSCGHVFCKLTIENILMNIANILYKCPSCSEIVEFRRCKQLHF